MPKPTQSKVKVRMLGDHAAGACNSVQTLDKDVAKALVEQGVADASPEAVAYAEKEGRDR